MALIDMTGWIMKEHGVPDSRLTVIERVKNSDTKHSYWLCKCNCGNTLTIRGDQIRRGIAKSCGCLQREVSAEKMKEVGKSNKNKIGHNRVDLTGQVFGALSVIEFSHKEDRKLFWKCQCQCGKIIEVSSGHLLSNHTRSCGCLTSQYISNSNIINYQNQKIGKLFILEQAGIKEHSMYWHCVCDCGNKCVVSSDYLHRSKLPSCGCVRSIGESTIKKYLDILEYNYKQQYVFADLIDKNNLRFDFAIFKDNKLFCLIEYQGEQHFFNTTKGLWKNPDSHDKMKRQYCKDNGIKLIEIPYYDFKKINQNYLKELIEE